MFERSLVLVHTKREKKSMFCTFQLVMVFFFKFLETFMCSSSSKIYVLCDAQIGTVPKLTLIMSL